MPTISHPVVHDTLRVFVRDTVVIRDTVFRSLPPESSQASPWLIPMIAAAAAVTAGLGAQWFRVWLNHRTRRRRLVGEFYSDLVALEMLAVTLRTQYESSGRMRKDRLDEAEALLQSYRLYEGDLGLLGSGLRNRAGNLYRCLVRVIALASIGDPHVTASTAPANADDTLEVIWHLREMCREMVVAVSLELKAQLKWEMWWSQTPWAQRRGAKRFHEERRILAASRRLGRKNKGRPGPV